MLLLSMSDPVAPNAAKLMRTIAEAFGYRRGPQTRISEALGHEDSNLVNKWWSGKRRIGDDSRDELVRVFPTFAEEIDAAIAADLVVRGKRRGKRRAARAGTSAARADTQGRVRARDALEQLLDALPDDPDDVARLQLAQHLDEIRRGLAHQKWSWYAHWLPKAIEEAKTAGAAANVPKPTLPPPEKGTGTYGDRGPLPGGPGAGPA